MCMFRCSEKQSEYIFSCTPVQDLFEVSVLIPCSQNITEARFFFNLLLIIFISLRASWSPGLLLEFTDGDITELELGVRREGGGLGGGWEELGRRLGEGQRAELVEGEGGTLPQFPAFLGRLSAP